jgi:hypothetical protein
MYFIGGWGRIENTESAALQNAAGEGDQLINRVGVHTLLDRRRAAGVRRVMEPGNDARVRLTSKSLGVPHYNGGAGRLFRGKEEFVPRVDHRASSR